MSATTLPGAIRADECYPLDVFARVSGLGRHALRRARRDGLVVRRVGLRSYVLGADWMTYLERRARVVDPATGKPVMPPHCAAG